MISATLSALLVIGVPLQTSVAAAPPPVAATDAAVAARAMMLARTLNSDAIIVGDDKSDAKAVKMATELFGTNEDIKALEVEHPGISLEMARGMMPIINRSARERLPVLWQRQADLYGKHFSASELDTLNAFYQSPTGQKLISAMMANIDPKAMVAEAKRSDDFKISATSVLTDIKAAVPDMLKQMDDTDNAALEKLGRSGLMTKMKVLAPATQTTALAWMNESAPWEDAELEKVIEAIVQRRVAEKTK
jgi:hypothetical protein